MRPPATDRAATLVEYVLLVAVLCVMTIGALQILQAALVDTIGRVFHATSSGEPAVVSPPTPSTIAPPPPPEPSTTSTSTTPTTTTSTTTTSTTTTSTTTTTRPPATTTTCFRWRGWEWC